jgi:hypothetical protein
LGEGEVVAGAGVVGVEIDCGLMGGEGFFAAAEAKERVAAVGGGGFVAEGFGLFEGLRWLRSAGCDPRSQNRDLGHPGLWLGGVLGQEEDAAGVGDFGVLAIRVCGFGGMEGLPGLGEVGLLEVEVGEGQLDLGVAGMIRGGELERLAVMRFGLREASAVAVEMAEVEVGGDPGACFLVRQGPGGSRGRRVGGGRRR